MEVPDVPAFSISFKDGFKTSNDQDCGKEGLSIITVSKSSPCCRGSLLNRACTLRQATVEYDARITNGSIALVRGRIASA